MDKSIQEITDMLGLATVKRLKRSRYSQLVTIYGLLRDPYVPFQSVVLQLRDCTSPIECIQKYIGSIIGFRYAEVLMDLVPFSWLSPILGFSGHEKFERIPELVVEVVC